MDAPSPSVATEHTCYENIKNRIDWPNQSEVDKWLLVLQVTIMIMKKSRTKTILAALALMALLVLIIFEPVQPFSILLALAIGFLLAAILLI